MECPCCSGKLYKDCCQPLHEGKIVANALSLMRSRYAAYSLGLSDYIIATTHSSVSLPDKQSWEGQIILFFEQTEFVNLTILEFIDGKKEAFVTFFAELIQNQQDVSFVERSRFLKESGRSGKWKYVDGVVGNREAS